MSELFRTYRERILAAHVPDESPADALVLADYFQEHGDLRLTATALDRAYGLAPDDQALAARRKQVLDSLAVVEHGICFRYVPAGTFLMGSDSGDQDELPVHAVRLGDYWAADVPVTWAAYCQLLDWPQGVPRDVDLSGGTCLGSEYELRGLYSAASLEPSDDDERPMVAVSWQSAEELCEHLSTSQVTYRLPTEAEWEKAARGGLIQRRYSWGDDPPSPEICNCDRFGEFSIRPPRELPPNGYGLYGMCGGVWEWTVDRYDRLAYKSSAPVLEDEVVEVRALRGGSWSDCPEAATVSFRFARGSSYWRDDADGDDPNSEGHITPTIGFRLFRFEADA